MDFIEELTPKGHSIKILFKKWQFLAFDKKGRSIYTDADNKGLLHNIPIIIFVGDIFKLIKEYDKEYSLLKIRKGVMIIPYKDIRDRKMKYMFIDSDKQLDMIPARMFHVNSVVQMVKNMDATTRPDLLIIDDKVTSNDVIIIKNRYKLEDEKIINAEIFNTEAIQKNRLMTAKPKKVNLNILSSNPVFLARIHLRSMELSKINQLLLDFDLTALDTEYILNFINIILKDDIDKTIDKKNRAMLANLKDLFQFYFYLMQKNDVEIREMIDSEKSLKKLAPYKTLVAKVKAIFPGKEEQLLFSEYENVIFKKQEEFKNK